MRVVRLLGIGIGILLAGAATTRGQAQDDASATFAQKCAMCHGKAGAGDGPAAVALTPKPPNFADPNVQAAVTDEALAAAITNGKGSMPAYKEQLTPQAIKAMVAYLRTLAPLDAKR